jgi:hypothetical protein
MKEIEAYIEIHDEIDRCDFRINVLRQEEADREELADVRVKKATLEAEIAPLTTLLGVDNINEADLLRTGYISVFNNYLDAFTLAAREGKFVDLDQSMINPGYLLGMPVHDLYNVAKSAGEIIPLSYFMYTYRKWEFSLLLTAITNHRASIIQRQFHNYLQGIEFYFEFRQAIREIADQLRADRVIY